MITILGAGLSGLIAAIQFPSASVIEANAKESVSHRAVLRFRSDALSRLTGIPFKSVTVRKGIWYDGKDHAPSIRLSNFYSKKTNGMILDRSIWNLAPVERFIAPEDLQQQMVDMIGPRIYWGTKVLSLDQCKGEVISTIPMPALLKIIDREPPVEFRHAEIRVDRYRVKGANVYQTIYFPDPDDAIYRASITGDLLIIESVPKEGGSQHSRALEAVCEAFGLKFEALDVIDIDHAQRFGKIVEVDDEWRRRTIFQLSVDHRLYSMGRFAIWKNILLDDVVKDGAVIKRLINQGHYGAALHSSRLK